MKNLKEIICQHFHLPMETEDAKINADAVQGWDSLAHMNVISLIEEVYDVSISEEEVMQMMSLTSIKKILEEKMGP